ncbi:MAG: radical SAM family heme chaperone HemW [Anaerolineae bacterium]|nr:radical SAM family heme chaperone HemW [Anaerolineae bacterium]
MNQLPFPNYHAISIYLHIPFCKARCSYCGFNTYAGLDDRIEDYLAALRREIEMVGQSIEGGRPVAHTLYLGGGTPSLLTPGQVETLLAACHRHFSLPPGAEISLEANPGTVDLDRLRRLREIGVNRLSLGVQSAQAADLKLFKRIHSFADAVDAFQAVRRAGYDNISIDLIYGAPGQTPAGWEDTLNRILDWEPEHVSLYSLSIEEDTPLERQIEQGVLDAPDPDRAADMYEQAQERLSKAGFQQYELSNWARPGHECQHNRQYWLNEPYLGLGAGAYGTFGGLRYWNVEAVGAYIERISQAREGRFPPSPAAEDCETIDQNLAMVETMILGLRLTAEGVRKERFARRFGREIDAVFGETITRLAAQNLLTDDGQSVRLTRRAYLISNRVLVHFIGNED